MNPCPPDTLTWRYGLETHAENERKQLLYWGKDGKSKVPRLKMFLDDAEPVVPRSVWSATESGSTQTAMTEQKILHSTPFATPKPEQLIQRILHIATVNSCSMSYRLCFKPTSARATRLPICVGSGSFTLSTRSLLEFIDLPESPRLVESKLEQALIGNLETFLLELGKGFAFVSRQERITLDGDHFYIDLVFYHTILKCYVLVDLKVGKLTHQDIGQTQFYVNYFDRERRTEGDQPTLGLILCSDKNDAVVRYTLGEKQT